MYKTIISAALLLASSGLAAQTDLMSDTWVATDALGRVMPDASECPLRTDKPRTVGIFYITWHDEGKFSCMKSPYGGDVSRTLVEDKDARLDAYNPAWKEWSLHWGEPEDGYFLSQDTYIIRKDMSMLTDAGVDLLFLDVTNAVHYWDEWEALFSTMEQMKKEGNKVPKICFWSFNGDAVSVVTKIYERIYKPERYKDLWFYWDGKPLLCYNADPGFDANGHRTAKSDYGDEIRNFFTLRNLWWGYYEWNGKQNIGTGSDNWFFGYEMNDPRVASLTPEQRAAYHNGRPEQMAVTTAQHSISQTGKSWRVETGEPQLDDYDLPKSAYVPWLGHEVDDPEGYGIYFQDRWDEALSVDPDLIYINDWNEWTAGKFLNPIVNDGDTLTFDFMGRKSDFFFVDQYNAEFNRTIQPMKGGYTDNYYHQLVQNIRRYKGVRERPTATKRVKVGKNFADWDKVGIEFLDTRGDVAHRDHNGYGGLHYTNTSGRNDIVRSKVAAGKKSVSFYAETADKLTPSTDPNWMLLFIDADGDHSTGWNGYDLLVNRRVASSDETALMTFDGASGEWKEVALVPYKTDGNRLQIDIPASYIPSVSADSGYFDFKWSDNPASIDDIIELCINGDTAPNRRFNYRYQWNF